jgi:hypothetical protein
MEGVERRKVYEADAYEAIRCLAIHLWLARPRKYPYV